MIFFLPVFIFIAPLAIQSAQDPSSQIQDVTACWILTVRDNTKHNKTLDKLLEAQSYHENQMKAKNKTELFYKLQVNMVKKCFQVISKEDVQNVLESMQNPNATYRNFRQIVQNFDYGAYLKEQKYGSEIKNEQIDQLFLSMILELEKQLGFFPAQEMREAADKTTYLFGVTSKNFVYLSYLAILLLAFAAFILCTKTNSFSLMFQGRKLVLRPRRMRKSNELNKFYTWYISILNDINNNN